MTIVVKDGIIFQEVEVIKIKRTILSKEELEDEIKISARDGENLNLIASFAKGEFSSVINDYKDLMRQIIFTSYLNDHFDVIKTIFESDERNFSYISKYILGYSEIKDIYDQVVESKCTGDQSSNVDDLL